MTKMNQMVSLQNKPGINGPHLDKFISLKVKGKKSVKLKILCFVFDKELIFVILLVGKMQQKPHLKETVLLLMMKLKVQTHQTIKGQEGKQLKVDY